MAGKRWLNIVVDGNIALQPYWHDIVSNYLETIIRSFRGNLREEAYLGLVLYNANIELDAGFDIQFINWTRDANKFLENLSRLTFNGSDVNNCTMAEGLAEALVMYPKPSDIMPTIDYYNAERHCILVASNDPTPKKMMLCLPMINQQGNLVGQRLMTREADFLNVSQMFPLLKISLSVITPNSLPIFNAIFNLGNEASLSNVPRSSYSKGQLTVLMAKSFQYAHNALIQENRASTIVEPINTTPTIPRVLATSNTSSPACEVSIGERIGRASRTESASSQPLNFQELVFPNEVSPKEIALASFGHSQMNVYDDIIVELSAGIDIFTPSKRSKTVVTLDEDNLKGLFELDQQLSFDCFNNSTGQKKGKGESSSTSKMISIEALEAVEAELEQALQDGSNKTSNVQAHTSSVGEDSTRLFQGIQSDNSILYPILNSENPSSSKASVPQQQPLSLGEQYSTRLFQDLTISKSIPNSMFISDNPSSSASLAPQQHTTSHNSVPNPILNSENPSSFDVSIPQQQPPSVGEEYSTSLLHGITSNKSILNPMSSLETSSHSNFDGLLPQQPSSSLWPTEAQALDHQHGLMNNATQISTGGSYSDHEVFSNTIVNSLSQFQSYSLQNYFPMPQDANATRPVGGIFSDNKYESNYMASFGALNSPTFGTFNHQRQLLPVPTIDKFRYYVQTWEGSLIGKIHPNRVFVIKAKAFKNPTTPLTLPVKWKNKLEILNFIPEKAVGDTKSIYYPIDYVFFHVVKYNNVNLYKYLKSSNLCGKVDLSFQSIIISPTKKENYFLGTVFDRSAVFVERH